MKLKKPLIYKIIGMLLCILPAAITALTYFPLWMHDAKCTVSILAVAVLALAAIPARRVITRALKSPSAWQFWLVMWVSLSLLNSISTGLRAVSAVAFPTSLAGAVFFYLARREEARLRASDGQTTQTEEPEHE